MARDDLGTRMPVDQFLAARRLEQRDAQVAIGEHPTERAFVRFGDEIDPPRLHRVGHRDVLDSAAQWFERIGEPDIAEQVPARGADRAGPAVDALGGQLFGRSAVDDVARNALPGGRQRAGHPDQPTAEDQEVATFAHSDTAPQVLPLPGSRSRQRPSNDPSGTSSPISAASVGAISTVSTGTGCSKPSMPLRQKASGTRRS